MKFKFLNALIKYIIIINTVVINLKTKGLFNFIIVLVINFLKITNFKSLFLLLNYLGVHTACGSHDRIISAFILFQFLYVPSLTANNEYNL